MHQHAFLVSLLPLVAAHGFLASPPARRPGSAFRAACGEQPFYQQSADINGNVQGIQQVTGSDKTAACNLWLCKGFQFEDNKSNVQTYSLGQTIDIRATIAAPHTGYANVSVVKTSTNSMIGTPLIEFQNYASNAGVAANNTAFSVTLPNSLGGECTTAGDCVLQWFWDAPNIDQTYESCVDFVVSGSGSSSPAPSSSAAASSAVATSTATSAVGTSVETAVPTVTSATAVTSTSTDAAPATTTTAAPGSGDDECPAEDDEDGEGDDKEECPADGEDDGEDDDEECPADDGEGDDEECPADDGEGGNEPTATTSFGAKDLSTTAAATVLPTSFGAKDLSTTAAATVPSTSIVTLVLTSTVTTERVVTVTAAPTACN